jgi:[ribosomal protein S18]-alanine N-acetyltransferase
MMLNNLYLKLLTEEYLDHVIKLDQQCLGGLWSIDSYKREIESPNSCLLSLSIFSEENAQEKVIGLGVFWAILEEAHITILAIDPDFQGQGLGKFLLLFLLKEAVKRGLERATLEVKESNEVARSLYEKFGFKLAGKRKKYYQDTGEDALILWLGNLVKPEFTANLIQWERQIGDRLKNQHWQLWQSLEESSQT